MSATIYKAEPIKVEALAIDAPTAAKLVGLSESTVRKLARAGLMPSKRVLGRLLFSVDRLREWLADETPVDDFGGVAKSHINSEAPV